MSTSSETLFDSFRVRLVIRWRAWCRARTRRALQELDRRLLADVGLVRTASGDFERMRPEDDR